MKASALIGSFLIVASFMAQAQTLSDLTYITENAPPWNYLEQDRLEGMAVDLLEQVTDHAGASVKRSDIMVLPWARAYSRAKTMPNQVIFSIFKTPARERLFKWAGPFAKNRLVLIAKKSRNISIDNLDQLELYTIGAQREEATAQELLMLNSIKEKMTLGIKQLQLAKM
ncbi:transporter substrate-binding domain-containing protein [Simiduia curdlanivorans]|uniref:Substrate-binding periplasmic protein n=1 Tax=Simiduia curdlanivorans TaxID=1492769 RepID=A0ABV8V538_9GAMM|nr:transporter substrate-binding domain-containing protein [Simiduia curdlanivorans]MDN3640609.1 transporter substrate-binding domain-containing protein [Simiduia curdlanivorans]